MYPEFLCIGATKAGTTWLYLNLRNHPQLWLAPVKEVHYFNWTGRHPTLLRPLYNYRFQLNRAYRFYRYREFRRPNQPSATWWLRFWLQPRTDGWYNALFTPSAGQLAGEIAPTYATVPVTQVEKIQRLMPAAKLIYIMREPIARSWSQLQMVMRHKNASSSINDDVIRQFMRESDAHDSSNYMKQIEKWERIYPVNAIFFCFYDQLAADPQGFLRSVLNFLEVDDKFAPKNVTQKHNFGTYQPIPDQWAATLARQYHPSLIKLHARFDNEFTRAWLQSAESHL